MFLKNIRLENFKGLKDIEISFENNTPENRKWTLILGENGTGKSNLLKAIALVTAGSNALGELIGNADNWVNLNAKKCRIIADLETKDQQVRHLELVINRGDTLSKIIANNHNSLLLIDEAIENSGRNYFVVGYGSSRRLNSDPFTAFEKARQSKRALNVRSVFDNSFSLNPLTSWAIELDYSGEQKGNEIIKQTLKNFLPGTTYKGIDRKKKQLLFQTPEGIIPLDQLSDGYQNMAAWIGDLLYRITESFRDFKKPLEARGLLLIDELDLHLHPNWQRKLIDFINSKLPNFQVIATTHSPLTAQQAGENELYSLKRNSNNNIALIPFVGSPQTMLINQLLMSPVFGIESDESLEVQRMKKEFHLLKSKSGKLTASENKKLKEVTVQLSGKIKRQENTDYSSKELDLLKKLESHLK